MHEGEVFTDVPLVRRLLDAEFPQWANLDVTPVPSFGTDHDIYRLGEQWAVRLPRIGWAQGQAVIEAAWLPRLAPLVPLALPAPQGIGRATAEYPFTWSVVTWLRGRSASDASFDRARAVTDVARFVRALQAVPTEGAHVRPNGGRGSPLADLDGNARSAIVRLGDRIDTARVLRSWEESLEAPAHEGPEVWVHGDLLPGNLLVENDRITGVIDFGGLNVGDPACDLQPAWHLFEGADRQRFREELRVDDAAWLRGRGWVLYQAVMALPYYWTTNPRMVRQSLRALARVADE